MGHSWEEAASPGEGDLCGRGAIWENEVLKRVDGSQRSKRRINEQRETRKGGERWEVAGLVWKDKARGRWAGAFAPVNEVNFHPFF